MSLHVLASVLLVSLCSLTFDLYFISCYHHSFCFATSTFPVYSNPPPALSPLRGYLVAAPSVFRAGVEESVSVTIFNARAETRVQVQLSVKGQTVAHSHGSVLGENTF